MKIQTGEKALQLQESAESLMAQNEFDTSSSQTLSLSKNSDRSEGKPD